jgi:hypothetical protein
MTLFSNVRKLDTHHDLEIDASDIESGMFDFKSSRIARCVFIAFEMVVVSFKATAEVDESLFWGIHDNPLADPYKHSYEITFNIRGSVIVVAEDEDPAESLAVTAAISRDEDMASRRAPVV